MGKGCILPSRIVEAVTNEIRMRVVAVARCGVVSLSRSEVCNRKKNQHDALMQQPQDLSYKPF